MELFAIENNICFCSCRRPQLHSDATVAHRPHEHGGGGGGAGVHAVLVLVPFGALPVAGVHANVPRGAQRAPQNAQAAAALQRAPRNLCLPPAPGGEEARGTREGGHGRPLLCRPLSPQRPPPAARHRGQDGSGVFIG
jgi:hypothetical protein